MAIDAIDERCSDDDGAQQEVRAVLEAVRAGEKGALCNAELTRLVVGLMDGQHRHGNAIQGLPQREEFGWLVNLVQQTGERVSAVEERVRELMPALR